MQSTRESGESGTKGNTPPPMDLCDAVRMLFYKQIYKEAEHVFILRHQNVDL
jgi:hypothetical protein